MTVLGRSRSDHATRQRPWSGRATLLVVSIAVFLGVVTAFAQGWLPEQVGSLANSSGSWALLAFLLAWLAATPAAAAVFGSLSLLALLAGYIVGASMLGYPSSAQLIIFWGLAALLVGPPLGLGAFWVRHRGGRLAALGAGAISGVLIGEGAYGLAYIADTTYPPYWWGQIVVGLLLLLALMARRLPRLRDRALSLGICATTAVAFVAVYSRGSTLFGLLS